jgi:molybdopterin-guanine dinucleotide biosynthesis protein A
VTDVDDTAARDGAAFAPATVGILVGGQATRMRGVAKGLLPTASGETIVARTARVFQHVHAEAVLLGGDARYAHTGLPALADEAGVEGPLAGLLALLRRAPTTRVFLVGGDMPFVTEALTLRLARLLDQHDAVAAHDGERFLPLFSAFSGAPVRQRAEELVVGGARSPSAVLGALRAARLDLSREDLAALGDWDTDEARASGAS